MLQSGRRETRVPNYKSAPYGAGLSTVRLSIFETRLWRAVKHDAMPFLPINRIYPRLSSELSVLNRFALALFHAPFSVRDPPRKPIRRRIAAIRLFLFLLQRAV